MKHTDWIITLTSILASVAIVGGAVVWAGDKLWVSHDQLGSINKKLEQKIESLETRALDRQITFLQIKINQGEATSSEKIYIESLMQQLRSMRGSD